MKKLMMIIVAALFLCAAGTSEAKAQTIGQNAKTLGKQIVDSVKSKTPVIVETVKTKTPVIIDSVKSKTPVVIDSIKSKGSRAADKAVVVADSVLTKSKRWWNKQTEK